MRVKLKKNCNAEEHGLLGSAGDFIHVANDDADHLVKQGLAEVADKAKGQKQSSEDAG